MSTKGIKLGDEIEDVTSKLSGIAVARVEYLDGSVYWIVQPQTIDDNERIATQSVSEAYCRRIGEGVHVQANPPIGFHTSVEKAG